MRRNTIYSAVVGISLLVTGQAYAVQQNQTMTNDTMQSTGVLRSEMRSHEMPNVEKFQHAVSKLNLSIEQRQRIRDVFASAGPQFRQYWEQMGAYRYQTHQVLMTGGNNQSKLNSLARQEGQLFTNALKLKLQTMNQVIAVLTPEQRAKLQAMRESYRHKHNFRNHHKNNQ